MDDDTDLADLLKLNLHNFEDEVRGIVDKAVKEMGMEKVSPFQAVGHCAWSTWIQTTVTWHVVSQILKELDVTWSAMEFQYEPHGRTQIPLLQSDEELIETLEENQVCLAFL